MTDMTPEDLRTALAPINTQLAEIRTTLATIEGQLSGLDHRFAAVEGRLGHLQTIGTWLFASLLASYAAILAVALQIPHWPPL